MSVEWNTAVRHVSDDSDVQAMYVPKQGSRRGIIGTRRRHHEWVVSLKDFSCKSIHKYTGRVSKMPGIYRSILYKEGKE